MAQEIQPLDMKDYGFVPGLDLDELRPTSSTKDNVECYVYSELHEVRKHYKVSKNDPKSAKTYDEYMARKDVEYEGDDNSNYMFIDRAKKPVALLGHHKGPISEVNQFITGVQVTDGTKVVQSKSSAAHPRTYIAAIPGAYGNPPTYILDKAQVIRNIKDMDMFSEVRDVGEFSELVRLILENEQSRRR